MKQSEKKNSKFWSARNWTVSRPLTSIQSAPNYLWTNIWRGSYMTIVALTYNRPVSLNWSMTVLSTEAHSWCCPGITSRLRGQFWNTGLRHCCSRFSSSSVPVIITTTMGEKLRFLISYESLNRVIISNRWSPRDIDQIWNDSEVRVVFSTQLFLCLLASKHKG